jgi:hypothetical protein
LAFFVWLRRKNDYLWAAFLQAIPDVVAAVISFFILRAYYPETLCLSTIEEIKRNIKKQLGCFYIYDCH